MTSERQDQLSRARRLAKGCCPTHGIALAQVSSNKDGDVVACPRRDCDFETLARWGSKLNAACRGETR